jgi:hypothetical protein
MADITFFDDPGQAPQPRGQIRLEQVSLDPYPDGRRVKISLRTTPFGPTDRPNLEITVRNPAGDEVASMSVIESLENDLALTVHLRGEENPTGTYHVEVSLFYDPKTIQHSKTADFALPPETAAP